MSEFIHHRIPKIRRRAVPERNHGTCMNAWTKLELFYFPNYLLKKVLLTFVMNLTIVNVWYGKKILNGKYLSRRIGLVIIRRSYTGIPSAHKTQADFRAHFGVKKVRLIGREIRYFTKRGIVRWHVHSLIVRLNKLLCTAISSALKGVEHFNNIGCVVPYFE